MNQPAIVVKSTQTSPKTVYCVAILVPRGKEASYRANSVVNGLSYIERNNSRHFIIDPKLVYRNRGMAESAMASLFNSGIDETFFIAEA